MKKIPGNLQRIHNGERRYAITPRIPGGFIQADTLQRFVDVAKKFNAVLKITGGQRILITNLKAEDLEEVWSMLGMEPAYSNSNVVRSVKICPGTTFCKRAKQDSIHLGMQIERKYISKEMPSKMKIGISGCPNSCSEAITKDIGVIGNDTGWQIYAGGSAGAHPRFADFITEVETEQEVLTIIDSIIAFYKNNAQIERMGAFIDRIGIDAFKKATIPEQYSAPLLSKDTLANVAPISTVSNQLPEYTLQFGDTITADAIVRNIIDVYPETIPALQDIGMGCLGCPSATSEPLHQAADIHGYDINELLTTLNAIRKG